MCTVTVMAYGAAEGGSDLLVVVLRALTARIGRSGDAQIDHIPPYLQYCLQATTAISVATADSG